ncbi:MAG: hypothetical protein BWX63_00278 [Bacteroidetes bacterium ADurb.Bin041]|jgi:hypothetical protein|nr:MAG: hypothetical protein BWX63_00278 [Bacteroidetes bacterium ADurb.Bin041]
MSDEIKIFAPIFFQKFYLVTFFRKEWAGLYFILLDLRKTTMNIFFLSTFTAHLRAGHAF